MAARLEMQSNRSRDQGGTVQHLLYRPEPVAPAPTPVRRVTRPVRNFAMENKQHIRLMTAENKLARTAAAQATPHQATFSVAKCNDVESRFFKEAQRSSSDGGPRFDYLQSGSKSDWSQRSPVCSSDGSAKSSMVSRPGNSIPSCSGRSQRSLMQCEKKNFMRINEEAAHVPKPVIGNADYVNRTEGYLQKLDRLPKSQIGEVPSYLRKRQEDWKQIAENATAAAQRATIPVGCQLMEESEKIAIVEELKRSKAAKELELFRLPIRNDTLRVRTRRDELEATLTKLDEHLELLSKPKVYVPIDPMAHDEPDSPSGQHLSDANSSSTAAVRVKAKSRRKEA